MPIFLVAGETFRLQAVRGCRKTIYVNRFTGDSVFAMSEKAVSINDVAKMAGVSPATVSNALTGRKKVSAELARKVEAAVRALDYRADPLASMIRSSLRLCQRSSSAWARTATR